MIHSPINTKQLTWGTFRDTTEYAQYTMTLGRLDTNQIYMIGFGYNVCFDTMEATVSEQLIVVTQYNPSSYSCTVDNPIINKDSTTLLFNYTNHIAPAVKYYRGKTIKQ